jgi:ABC-2 type transport system permease protein
MRTISVLVKELLHSIRDKKSMMLMIAFPILLILILGTAFANVFGDNENIKIDAKVLYKNESGSELTKAFDTFRQGIKDLGVTFIEVDDDEKAKMDIKDAKYSCYIKLYDKEIKIYKNDRYNFQATFVETVLNTFVERYNLIIEVVKVNPKALEAITVMKENKFVNKVSLERERTPRAIDYYAITMISLIILYSSMGGAYGIGGERTRKTGNRILLSPITKKEYLVGKISGLVLLTIIQIAIVVFVSKYLLKTYWGDNLPLVMLVLISEIIMAVSLGVGIAFIMKSESAASGVLNAIIPFMVFLGGGYVPLEQFNSDILLKITNISPVRWVNKSILNLIFSGDSSMIFTAIIINITTAVVMIVISSILFRKEAV